jgi:alkylation response protein AidB-like acyl-CoA dehydrogenase
MDLKFSAAHEAFRREVKAFLAANWDSRAGHSEGDELAFRSKATEQGYLYRNIPRRFGGSEQTPDLLKSEIIRQEFQKARAPLELRARGIGLVVPTILNWGTEEQKEAFIRKTLTGEITWSQGYSEPSAGSDLASLRTRADLVNGKWIINGQKVWSSEAHTATHMFMLVRTEQDKPKHSGISYLIVELNQPGITIRPLKQITGDMEFNEVFFNDAETPENMLVGQRGRGWEVSRTTLKHERTNMNGMNYSKSMLERLVALAKTTQIGGRAAIKDPVIRDNLAALHSRLLATQYSTERHLSMSAAGQSVGGYELMMKIDNSNLAERLYRLGRDIVGDDFLLMQPGKNDIGTSASRTWVRQAMTSLRLTLAGGTSNIQRNIIAERVLGLPRDERTQTAKKPAAE